MPLNWAARTCFITEFNGTAYCSIRLLHSSMFVHVPFEIIRKLKHTTHMVAPLFSYLNSVAPLVVPLGCSSVLDNLQREMHSTYGGTTKRRYL